MDEVQLGWVYTLVWNHFVCCKQVHSSTRFGKKNMSISGELEASRLSNEDDEKKLANPVGVTLFSDRSVQLKRNISWYEGNIGEEIRYVRSILSSTTDVSDSRSKAVTEDQSGLDELSRRKTNSEMECISVGRAREKTFKTEQKNDRDIKHCCIPLRI